MASLTTAILDKKEVGIDYALQLYGTEIGKDAMFRCPECLNRVRPHKAGGGQSAHFEHLARNPACSLSHRLRRSKLSSSPSVAEGWDQLLVRWRANEFVDAIPTAWLMSATRSHVGTHDIVGRTLSTTGTCVVELAGSKGRDPAEMRARLDYADARVRTANEQSGCLLGVLEIDYTLPLTESKIEARWISEGGADPEFAESVEIVSAAQVPLDPAVAATEGGRRFVRHIRVERSSAAVKDKKAKAGPNPACEACGFVFNDVYRCGSDFCEVHHLKPLSIAGITKTSTSDLAILCSNCHRMIHRELASTGADSMTIAEFIARCFRRRNDD